MAADPPAPVPNTSLRSGEFVARINAAGLLNPYTAADKTKIDKSTKLPIPVTAFACLFARPNLRSEWILLGTTAPISRNDHPDFPEPFAIPYDLGQAPQVRVEVYDLVNPSAGPDDLPAQFFLGATEFDLAEIIQRDYIELTHRLENAVDPKLSGPANRSRCGTISLVALELRGSMAALARYAKANKATVAAAAAAAGSTAAGGASGPPGALPTKAKPQKYLISADAYELRLADRDTVAPSPFVVYFTRRAKDDKWKVLGRTRTVLGERAPKFVDQFPVVLYSEEGYVRVEVYNQVTQSDNLLDQQFIGATEVSMLKLISAPGMKGRLVLVNSLVKDIKPGEITLRMEYIDYTKSKVYIDVESGAIRKKGLGGGKARISYRLSVFERQGWVQVHESPFRTSGENAADASPAVRLTATLSDEPRESSFAAGGGDPRSTTPNDEFVRTPTGEENIAAGTQTGSLRSDIKWERAAHRVDEGTGARFKIEFIHQKKPGAALEPMGTSEVTLGQLRALDAGEFIPVNLDESTVGKLVLKHSEKSDQAKYFSLLLVYVESTKFKGGD